jgi:hypothetical protein
MSAKLAKLPINPELGEWVVNLHNRHGAHRCIPPFYIDKNRFPEDADFGRWGVFAESKKGGHVEIATGFTGEFDALRAMVDALEAWQNVKPVERVYFIGTELKVGALIKVGFSQNPAARLATLQTAHPHPLQIFATVEGGRELELKYHRRWNARRRSGEWFTVGKCIIDEIERLST